MAISKLISTNPANEEIINSYIQHTSKEIDDIIIQTSLAQSKWKAKDIFSRIEIFH